MTTLVTAARMRADQHRLSDPIAVIEVLNQYAVFKQLAPYVLPFIARVVMTRELTSSLLVLFFSCVQVLNG